MNHEADIQRKRVWGERIVWIKIKYILCNQFHENKMMIRMYCNKKECTVTVAQKRYWLSKCYK